MKAQTMSEKHGMNSAATDALPWVLHAMETNSAFHSWRRYCSIDPTAAALAEKYPVGALLVKRYEF